MKRFQIFRPGTFTDASGKVVTLSAADLAASAAAYDPAKHEAPIVIGHPKLDDAAYGWVKSVVFSEDAKELLVDPDQVDVQFSELVQKGSYKKVSPSFYEPTSPQNPVPGVWYLRHVGFLGATPPAAKGMRPVEFGEAEEGVVEFSDWATQQITETNARLWRALRDWLIESKGVEAADKIVPEWLISSMVEMAQRQPEIYDAAFAEFAEFSKKPATPPATPTARESELAEENARLRQQLDAASARDSERERTERHENSVAFAESLIAAGTLAPKHKDAVVAVLDAVTTPAADGSVVEFGEGDDKQQLPEALRGFLKELPKVVDFSEQARKDRAAKPDNKHPLIADAERRHNT